MASLFKQAREYFTPVLQKSLLEDKGVLTPEEFVCAGDQLVYKCPTWSWSAGDASSRKSYLPHAKQFLITKGVPCLKRVAALEAEYIGETEVPHDTGDGVDGGWLECHNQRGAGSGSGSGSDGGVSGSGDGGTTGGGGGGGGGGHGHTERDKEDPSMPMSKRADAASAPDNVPSSAANLSDDDSEYEDMATFEAGEGGVEDSATLGTCGDNVVRTRTYDLSITYDKYYQARDFFPPAVPYSWGCGRAIFVHGGASLTPYLTPCACDVREL